MSIELATFVELFFLLPSSGRAKANLRVLLRSREVVVQGVHWWIAKMVKAFSFLLVVSACLLLRAHTFKLSPSARIGSRLSLSMHNDFFPFSNSKLDSIVPVRQQSMELNAEKKDGKGGMDARQLMGIKGAEQSKNIWAIRLQLMKPVTWIPLIWGVACGAAASGNYHTWNPFDTSGTVPGSLIVEDALKAFSCMLLSGPILTGYTQTINDWEGTNAHITI